MTTIRVLITSLAASVGWFFGFMLSFVPAQALLADPDRQSPKLLAAFFTMAPPPRLDSPAKFALLVLVLGAFLTAGYRLSRPDRAASPLREGLRFGALAWLIAVPWFELYLPWNVLHEPMTLVLLEALCWAITLACSSMALATMDHLAARWQRKAMRRSTSGELDGAC